MAAFQINGGVNGETADALYVVFNANKTAATVTLPAGNWNVYVNGEKAGTEILDTVSGTVTVEPISALVLVQEAASVDKPVDTTEPDASTNDGTSGPNWGVIGGVAAGMVAAAGIGAAIAVVLDKKKKK